MRPAIGAACAWRCDNQPIDLGLGIGTIESDATEYRRAHVLVKPAINRDAASCSEVGVVTVNQYGIRRVR